MYSMSMYYAYTHSYVHAYVVCMYVCVCICHVCQVGVHVYVYTINRTYMYTTCTVKEGIPWYLLGMNVIVPKRYMCTGMY